MNGNKIYPILVGYSAVWNDKRYHYQHEVRHNMSISDAIADAEEKAIELMPDSTAVRAKFTEPLSATVWYGALGALNDGELHTVLVELTPQTSNVEQFALGLALKDFDPKHGYYKHGVSINKIERI